MVDQCRDSRLRKTFDLEYDVIVVHFIFSGLYVSMVGTNLWCCKRATRAILTSNLATRIPIQLRGP